LTRLTQGTRSGECWGRDEQKNFWPILLGACEVCPHPNVYTHTQVRTQADALSRGLDSGDGPQDREKQRARAEGERPEGAEGRRPNQAV